MFEPGEFVILSYLYLTRSPNRGHDKMGKGDKRTKRGKIFRGSFGKSRPKAQPVSVKKKDAAAAQS